MRTLLTLFMGALITLVGLLTPLHAATYGPVQKNQTLWDIASRNRPSESINTQQMMLAIHRANPKAFVKNNINALKAGAILYLPSVSEIEAIGAVQAIRTTQRENDRWRELSNRTYSKQQAEEAAKNIASLKAQLKQAQTDLAAERKKVKSLQSQLAAARNNPSKEVLYAVSDNELALKVQDLETIIQEKDVHIQQLETMVETARETIKRQAAENELMYQKLVAADPNTVSNTNPDPSKFGLSLQGAEAQQATALTDTTNTAMSNVSTDNDNELSPIPPLLSAEDTQPASKLNADRFAMILAIISLILLLVFLWRAYMQMEAKKAKMAESRLERRDTLDHTDNPTNDDTPFDPNHNVTKIRKEPTLTA
ncbi:MAG: FimV/HubP family polar landmark protein [bacterium]